MTDFDFSSSSSFFFLLLLLLLLLFLYYPFDPYSSNLFSPSSSSRSSCRVNMSTMKAAGFDTTFTNALGNKNVGGAYGGADFNPANKSETEIQVSV